MASSAASEEVRRPTGWLFLAFLGVWIYLISVLLQLYYVQVAATLRLNASDVNDFLGVASGFGQIFVFAGLVAALWRSNLAAGLTSAGVTGLVLGAASVGILSLFEFALVMDFLSITIVPISSLLLGRTLGFTIANFLGFAGLASLAVGLTQATGLWRRLEIPEPRLAPTPTPTAAAAAPAPSAPPEMAAPTTSEPAMEPAEEPAPASEEEPT